MGFIYEKDQAFKDAADHYEKAWRLGNCSNPNIGEWIHTHTHTMNAMTFAPALRLQAGLQLPQGSSLRGRHRRVPPGPEQPPSLPAHQERHNGQGQALRQDVTAGEHLLAHGSLLQLDLLLAQCNLLLGMC